MTLDCVYWEPQALKSVGLRYPYRLWQQSSTSIIGLGILPTLLELLATVCGKELETESKEAVMSPGAGAEASDSKVWLKKVVKHYWNTTMLRIL